MTPTSPEAPRPAPPRRLVVVDDDRLFLGVFAANLRAGGYDPLCFDDPQAALAALRAGAPAIACVLDLDMPGLDGLAFLRALKESGIDLPVVFVTSHSSPIFEEQALRDGAVEFIDKSRGPAIILRRLDLATRPRDPAPGAAAAPPDLRCGRLLLRCQARRAIWNGAEVPLSRTEFDVVYCLVAARGSDVSYRHIYDAVKGEGFLAGPGEEGYRANVRAMIKRIRRKFEEVDPGFASLGTYPGFGYHWRDDA
jgi:two-component system response regulator ChvI